MKEKLERLSAEAESALATAKDKDEVMKVRTQFLGRKGSMSLLVKQLGTLPKEERPLAGQLINQIKSKLEQDIDRKLILINELEKNKELEGETLDITLPGRRLAVGKKHPVTQVTDEITAIFTVMGFEIAEGPEVELDFYNFEALNIPKDHPARDMQDTFYISEEVLLRTHTSPVQIRTMEKLKPPVRIISPGKAYRCDSDVSHTPMFHQVEGFMVGQDISFSHLKGVLTVFAHQMFGEDTAIRFRPSFFPFTEPSAEMDIQCVMCKGGGCRVCSGSGWLEILGSGMVHPAVFKKVGYDPQQVSGFAFGMGIERIAMLKYGIDDIRLFFENDLRFLQQF
ncbi:MAG: phenylalanine--tRNA ligase subunit alpha [Thermodesulfobacteriota bacterium]